MPRYLLKHLFLSSILLLAFGKCSPLKGYKSIKSLRVDEQLAKPVIDVNQPLLFKAKIKHYNKQYSGLVIMKYVEPKTTYVTFVNEIGMKIFNFELNDSLSKITYLYSPLEKPALRELLRNDISLLLLQQLYSYESELFEKENSKIYRIKKGHTYFYKIGKKQQPELLIEKHKSVTKTIVYYSQLEDGSTDVIALKHKGFVNLKIYLQRIKQP